MNIMEFVHYPQTMKTATNEGEPLELVNHGTISLLHLRDSEGHESWVPIETNRLRDMPPFEAWAWVEFWDGDAPIVKIQEKED